MDHQALTRACIAPQRNRLPVFLREFVTDYLRNHESYVCRGVRRQVGAWNEVSVQRVYQANMDYIRITGLPNAANSRIADFVGTRAVLNVSETDIRKVKG